MNSLLSVLLCFAMLFSGAYGTEVPTDPHAASVTVSDVMLTLNGMEYPIDPTLSLAIETTENSLTLDAGVQLKESVLLPMQARLDDTGLAFTAGSSRTTYLIPASLLEELIGSIGVSTADPILSSSQELLSAIGLSSDRMVDQQLMLSSLKTAISDPEETETTIELEGEQVPVRCYTGVMDTAGILRCYDSMLSAASPELHAATVGLMNALLDELRSQLIVVDEASATALPEKLESLQDLAGSFPEELSELGIEPQLTVCLAEDGRGTARIAYTISEGEESITVPVDITVLGPDHAVATCELRYLEVTMSATSSVDGAAYQTDLSFDIEDEGSFGFFVTGTRGGAGSTGMTITDESEDTTVTLSAEWDGKGVTDFHAEYAAKDDVTALGFRLTTDETAVSDRLKDNIQVVFESVEELSGEKANAMLMDLGAALYADLTTLTSDSGVQAMMVAATGESATNEETPPEGDPDYTSDPDALPFTLPQLTRLPEDYTAREPVTYADEWSSCVTYDIDYTGSSTAYHSSLSLMLYKSSDTSVAWYAADGSPMESAPITVTRTEGFTEATMVTPDSVQVTLDCYDASIEDAVLVDILTGLVF